LKLKQDNSCATSSPWHPPTGGFNCFKDSWKFDQAGSGEITFTATGYDIYVALFDAPGNSPHYQVVIAGWNGSSIRLLRDGNQVGNGFDFKVADPTVYNSYTVRFDQQNLKIQVYSNGVLTGELTDSSWAAPNAQYFSLAQSGVNGNSVNIGSICKKIF